jgi:hypothetical protein
MELRILFRMQEQGLRQADIAPIAGGKLGFPSELLIRESAADYRGAKRSRKKRR